MAKLMLIGEQARVEILPDPEDEELILVRCAGHSGEVGYHVPACGWSDRHDTTDDAIADGEQHADYGRG